MLLPHPDCSFFFPFITLFLIPGYNFEHTLCFAPWNFDSSYSFWFNPQPFSEVCYVSISLPDKPSWLETLQPLQIPSLSPNSALIRVHSSGKSRWHDRKSNGFKSDNLISSLRSETYVLLRDPAKNFGRYFYKRTICNSAELRERTEMWATQGLEIVGIHCCSFA